MAVELFGLRVQVHRHWVQFYTRTKDMTITICNNKHPNRKWDWNMDVVMPRRDGPENLRILKRRLHYKVWLNGKVEQSRERSSARPYILV